MDSGKQQSKQIQRPTEPQENRRRELLKEWHRRKRGYYLDLVQDVQTKKNQEA